MSLGTTSRPVSSGSLPLNSPLDESPDEAMAEKAALILSACQNKDLEALFDLARSSQGLVNDGLRRMAWPILLGCSDPETNPPPHWSTLSPHRDEEQVAKDVNRAFVHYPKECDRQLDKRKEQLSDVIVEVLRRHQSLCYFQGFHDIVQVLYLVLGDQGAPRAVTRISLLRIRDYMLPSLDPAIRHLYLLPEIIRAEDAVLFAHLPKMQPNYALGATLTLFSHVIVDYRDITRLFDFFLASDTAVPIYFFASLLLSRRDDLLEIEKDEDEAIFHVMLGKLPQPFDVETRIDATKELYSRLPPQSLGWAWWKVSSSSVLKATKTPYDVATLSLDDGEALLRRQEKEMRLMQVYKRAASTMRRTKYQAWRYRGRGALGLSVVVGIYALWLGRQYGGSMPGEALKRIIGLFIRK